MTGPEEAHLAVGHYHPPVRRDPGDLCATKYDVSDLSGALKPGLECTGHGLDGALLEFGVERGAP